ncbi:MAG: hypothetical protein EXQ96_09850 [Alphaproteobacteria bacterium]|nr:hypothetical protein [Alphaproteobacteria bacterium]
MIFDRTRRRLPMTGVLLPLRRSARWLAGLAATLLLIASLAMSTEVSLSDPDLGPLDQGQPTVIKASSPSVVAEPRARGDQKAPWIGTAAAVVHSTDHSPDSQDAAREPRRIVAPVVPAVAHSRPPANAPPLHV